MSDNPAQQGPIRGTDTEINETETTPTPDPTNSDDTTIIGPASTSSDTSSQYTSSSTTSMGMDTFPTLGMPPPPKNVTITIPFAAIVVPPVLVVAGIMAFFGWRYWRRRRTARKLDEEKVAPFMSAEPQPGKEVVAATATATAAGGVGAAAGVYRNEKSLGTLNRLGGEKGERDDSSMPLLPLPLGTTSPSSEASSSNSTTTPFASRPSGSTSTRDEKVQRWRSDSPTPTASAYASAVGYLGVWPADQAVPREGDAAFAQYSQALNLAMQRAGFSPQALLESLNRVPVDDVEGAELEDAPPHIHMHSQRPPAYNG